VEVEGIHCEVGNRVWNEMSDHLNDLWVEKERSSQEQTSLKKPIRDSSSLRIRKPEMKK
jgi:hypothetical protein